MSTGSAIEWTNATWNPVVGCTRASSGCDHCYAVTMTHRLEAMGKAKYAGLTVLNGRGDRHFNGVVRTVPEALEIPLRWRKPRMIFVNSMSDLFHKDVPFEFIDRVFAVMALCPQHTFQVLTKRPERMSKYLAGADRSATDRRIDIHNAANRIGEWKGSHKGWSPVYGRTGFYLPPWPLPNIWLGTSIETQETADERIPYLLQCPAAVRFISAEPLLGPVDLRAVRWGHATALTGLDWVIVGGQSGPGARPCNIDWIRSIVSQCKAASVPVFVKQLGANVVGEVAALPNYRTFKKDRKGGDWTEWPGDLRVREFPKAVIP